MELPRVITYSPIAESDRGAGGIPFSQSPYRGSVWGTGSGGRARDVAGIVALFMHVRGDRIERSASAPQRAAASDGDTQSTRPRHVCRGCYRP